MHLVFDILFYLFSLLLLLSDATMHFFGNLYFTITYGEVKIVKIPNTGCMKVFVKASKCQKLHRYLMFYSNTYL